MRCHTWIGAALAACAAGVVTWWIVRADEPPKADAAAPLVVVDASGKEQKVTGWKFTVGTRPLAWLTPAPDALEFREDNSTLYESGILTLIPLDRLRSLDWDNEKEEVTAHVAVGPKADDDVVLTGPTGYKGINKIVLEAEVDKGTMGVAEFKYIGGIPKGIRGLRFPSARAPASAPPTTRPAVVTTEYKGEKTTHKVADLEPLYHTAGGNQLSPVLWFKKTLRLDVAKIKAITVNDSEDEPAWTVTDADGDQTLTPLLKPAIDGKPAELEGLLGRVPAGYKLFPAHTITQVQFDAADEGK